MSKESWKTITGFVRVASLGKTKGIDGAVKLKANEALLEQIVNKDFLFVEVDGNKVPMRVADYEVSGDLYVYFDGLRTKEEASIVVGRKVYLPEDQFQPVTEVTSDLEYAYLEGYTMLSEDTEVGSIVEVREFPQQEIAVVDASQGQVMIPIHQDLIIKIDEAAKRIWMQLPQGLLEL